MPSQETNTEIEKRGRPSGQFCGEVRLKEDAEGPIIEGYAAVFNKLSQPLEWGYRERIHPGAFAKTIKNGDVRALFNHDSSQVLGRTTSGTLTLSEDEFGLRYVVRPPDTEWARNLVLSIKRGDIDQSSFAFAPVNEDWSKEDSTHIRELREVRLFDVSPVTFPAYLDTLVHARAQSLAEVLNQTEPGTTHSEERAEPEQSEPVDHSEAVVVRDIGTLIKQWRMAGEAIKLDGGMTWHEESASTSTS